MIEQNKPNFLIVGTAKAGTSAVAKYLDAHSEVFIPEIKEPRYFLYDVFDGVNKKDPIYDYLMKSSVLDWDKYTSLYKNTDSSVKRLGDASVQYLYHHETVIPKIKNKLGDIPIIIILRDPTERAFSNFQFQNRNQFLSFEDALDIEDERMENKYNSFWYNKDMGLYCRQVKAYQDAFENVHVCLYDDLIKDMSAEMIKIYKFLNIDSSFKTDYKKRYNETITPRNKFLHSVYYFINKNNIRLKFLPKTMKKNIMNIFFSKQKNQMKEETERYLRGFFKNDIISFCAKN